MTSVAPCALRRADCGRHFDRDFTAQQLEGIRKRVLEGIADIEQGDYTRVRGGAKA